MIAFMHGPRTIRLFSLANKAMKYHSVFVYGTLKCGEPNHHLLTNSANGYAKLLSPAKTIEKYPLVIASTYNVPFLLYCPGKGANVTGEVYEVDNQMLSVLDELEEHPVLYEREVKQVQLENGTTTSAWIYLLKKFKPELMNLPTFENYSSLGSHNRPYLDSASGNDVSLADLVCDSAKNVCEPFIRIY